MKGKPIVVEDTYNAPIDIVWNALTTREELSKWFHVIDEFIPEAGYCFVFYTGGEEQKYEHVCRIIEIQEKKKLVFTWQYMDITGCSVVIFDLQDSGVNTFIRLTHENADVFPQDNPLFSMETMITEWHNMINIYLKEFAENKAKEKD